jgi:Cu/Ag efflux protein CusF
MKKLLFQCVLLVGLIAFGATACSNHAIDTAKLQTAFQSAPPDVRADLDKSVAAITAGKFSEALPPLQHVAFAAKMSDQQRLILTDTIKKVKARAK